MNVFATPAGSAGRGFDVLGNVLEWGFAVGIPDIEANLVPNIEGIYIPWTSGTSVGRLTTPIRECKEQPRLWQPIV